MSVPIARILIVAIFIQICRSSPLFFGSSSPTETSHIQIAKQTKDQQQQQDQQPTPDADEPQLFSQLLSEFSILAVEFVLQIVGISVGAFNIIRDAITQTFFPSSASKD
ncbi:hypothetical protein GE061_018237 [Apolygus lucorum]|uniref:Uncharacterized protein n=1 Tax=Apolygus lucorum TaxID=248454 RepID=A0A6A4J4S3_APOLU|nr:hypothetical protein GE061_018237 [Apolygus lucorum]